MISQTTIDSVFSASDIVDVIGRTVKLKRQGANHTGCCPFHDEKTPSFSVSPSKQIYKCFGCGKGGNVVDFVMASEKKNFPEAINYLAELYNIPVEEDQPSQQVPQETKDKKAEMQKMLVWVGQQYEKALNDLPESSQVKQYLYGRGYTDERIRQWGLGYAPADFKFLTTPLINYGKHALATELGIIKTREGQSHDFYHNRIIVPIHDHNGMITGFAARQVPTGTAEDKKWPKWMNPANSIIYQKAKTWYGLNTARAAISKAKMAYLVEGYPDVHSMQDYGIENTIAPCGKEIADEQIMFLKRYTNHVCFIPNIDENGSGQNAVLKHIDRFVAFDFKVSVVELPECNDADEYIRLVLTKETEAA